MDRTNQIVSTFLSALGTAVERSSRGQKMELVRLIDQAAELVLDGPESEAALNRLIDILKQMDPFQNEIPDVAGRRPPSGHASRTIKRDWDPDKG